MTLEGPVYSGLALLVWSADDKSRFGSQWSIFVFFFLFFVLAPLFSVCGGGFSACMNTTVMCKDTVVSIYDMHGWVGTPVRTQGSPADRSKNQVWYHINERQWTHPRQWNSHHFVALSQWKSHIIAIYALCLAACHCSRLLKPRRYELKNIRSI